MGRLGMGAPWAICDRCGFKVEVTELRKEWTGFRVCKDCYSIKPFKRPKFETVRPVRNARPDQDYSAGTTTLSVDAAAGATTIVLSSMTGVAYGASLGIQMNGGYSGYHWTTVTAILPGGNFAVLSEPLYAAASAGNTIVVPWTSGSSTSTAASTGLGVAFDQYLATESGHWDLLLTESRSELIQEGG
jgi:hypothetical protein